MSRYQYKKNKGCGHPPAITLADLARHTGDSREKIRRAIERSDCAPSVTFKSGNKHFYNMAELIAWYEESKSER